MGNSNKSRTFNLPDDSEYLGLFQSEHRLNFIATVSSSGNGWSMCGYIWWPSYGLATFFQLQKEKR